MLNFCDEYDYIISSKLHLPADSYSFVSETCNSETWLDHVVSSADFNCVIESMSISYDITDVDHIPLSLSLSVGSIPKITAQSSDCTPRAHWDSLSDRECRRYRSITEELLSNIVIPGSLDCQDLNCCNPSHVNDFKNLYDNIVSSLLSAGEQVSSTRKKNSHNRPGWTEYVSDLYKESKDILKLWLAAGKPRHDHLYELHRQY